MPQLSETLRILIILLSILSAITDTCLHKVVYDFNTKYTIPAERTVERLVAVMHIGEAALPLNEQFSHQVSNVALFTALAGTRPLTALPTAKPSTRVTKNDPTSYPAAGTAIDDILDSGATASIFLRYYKHFSKYTECGTPSYATMADSESKLKIYGTAMF